MRRVCGLLSVVTLFLLLCGCGQTKTVPTWQEQYDLGVRYLEEGNYEEAIIAFTAAIEIDPKRPEAYAGAADAYEALGDTEHLIAILEQGVEATGDSGLSARLAELQSTQDDAVGEPTEPQVGEPGSVTGTLDISNFQYQYEAGGHLAEVNEGAIGGIYLSFTVSDPANVKDASIWSWSKNGFSEEEIPTLINRAIEIWKSESDGDVLDQEVPFDCYTGFPVYPEYQSVIVDVLLIGIDENIDAVGYAIVTVAIP